MRSTGDRPVLSEAHQNLGRVINLRCCSKIRVAIQNADRYAGTVSMELLLRNTTLPGKPAFSLGEAKVLSTPPHAIHKGTPVKEILTFVVPAKPEIDRFDEITVAFHLTMDRSLVAARIGIEQFILVPHGSE